MPTKWKTSTNEDKWRTVTTTKWTKTSGGSPKQVPSLGVFDYFMIYVDNYFMIIMIICYYKWLFVIIYDYYNMIITIIFIIVY